MLCQFLTNKKGPHERKRDSAIQLKQASGMFQNRKG